MNVPYVKQFDKNGVVSNPIVGKLINEHPNRQERRLPKQKRRFYGESKNHHLTIFKTFKYKRVKQIEYDEDGCRKVIEHYIK